MHTGRIVTVRGRKNLIDWKFSMDSIKVSALSLVLISLKAVQRERQHIRKSAQLFTSILVTTFLPSDASSVLFSSHFRNRHLLPWMFKFAVQYGSKCNEKNERLKINEITACDIFSLSTYLSHLQCLHCASLWSVDTGDWEKEQKTGTYCNT